jgi:hypothetical protein
VKLNPHLLTYQLFKRVFNIFLPSALSSSKCSHVYIASVSGVSHVPMWQHLLACVEAWAVSFCRHFLCVYVSSSCTVELQHKTSISLHQTHFFLFLCLFIYSELLSLRTPCSWLVRMRCGEYTCTFLAVRPTRRLEPSHQLLHIWIPHSSVPIITQRWVLSPDTQGPVGRAYILSSMYNIVWHFPAECSKRLDFRR